MYFVPYAHLGERISNIKLQLEQPRWHLKALIDSLLNESQINVRAVQLMIGPTRATPDIVV